MKDKTPSRVATAFAVAAAIAIFLLTEQPADVTSSESCFVNDFLVGLFGGVPFLYDPDTGLWLGLDIRHWAHTVEFLVLGVFVAISSCLALRPRLRAAGGFALLICVACSLLDQCHKLFVPGRHFDGFDLVMDALGYGIGVLIVVAVVGVGERGRGRQCHE